jgi:hypothetical protein
VAKRLKMKNSKVYVAMTDKFMSGWGQAKGLVNKYVIECDNWSEAQVVKRNAESRSEMKYINVCINKPYYNPNRFLVSTANKETAGNWFIDGYFSKSN